MAGELLALQHEIAVLKNMLRQILRSQEVLFKKLLRRQQAELVACRRAFQLSVERDEVLRDTIKECADPWAGC